MIKMLLSFILGVGIGMVIMSCLVISKESEKNEENKKNK
jgi:hypothetical protein